MSDKVPAGDTHGSKPCKADLTALEHAFRAGWAACEQDSINLIVGQSVNTAWSEFLSTEMQALG